MKRILQLAGLLCLALGLPTEAGAAEEPIAVIVNKQAGVTRLSKSELRPIFQTKQTNWSGGETILPLNLPNGHSLRHGFDAAVLGLDPDRVARYWIDRKIRGGARPPKEIPSPALVVKVVSKKAGAIGYVGESQVDASVIVVARIVGGEVKAP